jgi:hypothetical protein
MVPPWPGQGGHFYRVKTGHFYCRTTDPRHLNIGTPTNGTYAVCITQGDERKGYYVRQIPSDIGGLAFHVEKFSTDRVEGEPSEYDVLIDEEAGHHDCDCLGQARWGHRHPCRHIAALLTLIATGKIAVKRPVPTPARKQAVPVPVEKVKPSKTGHFYCRTTQALLLRDVVVYPLRPVAFNSAWVTSAASSLAQGIYEDRAFDCLPILADALEEAGCDNADILNHCRQPGAHVRGCWVVDLLLNKS